MAVLQHRCTDGLVQSNDLVNFRLLVGRHRFGFEPYQLQIALGVLDIDRLAHMNFRCRCPVRAGLLETGYQKLVELNVDRHQQHPVRFGAENRRRGWIDGLCLTARDQYACDGQGSETPQISQAAMHGGFESRR